MSSIEAGVFLRIPTKHHDSLLGIARQPPPTNTFRLEVGCLRRFALALEYLRIMNPIARGIGCKRIVTKKINFKCPQSRSTPTACLTTAYHYHQRRQSRSPGIIIPPREPLSRLVPRTFQHGQLCVNPYLILPSSPFRNTLAVKW